MDGRGKCEEDAKSGEVDGVGSFTGLSNEMRSDRRFLCEAFVGVGERDTEDTYKR